MILLAIRFRGNLPNWSWTLISGGVDLVLVALMGRSVYERYTVEREMAARRIEVEQEAGRAEAHFVGSVLGGVSELVVRIRAIVGD